MRLNAERSLRNAYSSSRIHRSERKGPAEIESWKSDTHAVNLALSASKRAQSQAAEIANTPIHASSSAAALSPVPTTGLPAPFSHSSVRNNCGRRLALEACQALAIKGFFRPKGAASVRFFDSDLGLVVQSLHDPAEETCAGTEILRHQFAVRARFFIGSIRKRMTWAKNCSTLSTAQGVPACGPEAPLRP